MIEHNCGKNEPPQTQGTENTNGVGSERQNSRRESTSSQISSSATSPHYDSGNISDLNVHLCPASMSSAEDDSISSDSLQQNKIQYLLREKDQSLFLALQDVRKLKSELERLSKSEKWYKSELKLQRNSKLEVLEKLYTNERKFTQDNQNLQNERIALYSRCSELENQLHHEKERAMKLLKTNARPTAVSDEVDSRDFQLEQHQQRLADQDQLIDILRNQKRSLLGDLQKLSCERDEVVLQLQKNVAQLEDENRTITKRCLQLVESKIALSDEISCKEADWKSAYNEVLDLQIIVRKLQDKLHAQMADLNNKDHEIDSLKHQLSEKQDEDSVFNIKHHQELFEREQAILQLKQTIESLRTEITTLEALHLRRNVQETEIKNLRSIHEEQTSQIEKFKKLEEQKSSENNDWENQVEQEQQKTIITNALSQEENEQMLKKIEGLETDLNSIKSSQSLEQNSLRKTKTELDQVSQKYQTVCKLFEKSKFDLDMKDIAIEKFKFEKEKDTREIKSLREKLVEVSNQLDCQRTLAIEFEFLLSKTQQEMNQLKAEKQCNIEKILKLRNEADRSANGLQEKDLEIEDLKSKLLHANELKKDMALKSAEKILEEKQTTQRRFELMKRLVSLQEDKVDQLNAEQEEWTNLLTTLDGPKEPRVSCSEFDDLNELFDEQNLELIQLNENFHRQSKTFQTALRSIQEENKIFKERFETANLKIRDLESQMKAIESANVDYQKEISHLAGKNERLIQEFNRNFSQKRESHKKQIKQIEFKVKLGSEEKEIDQLKSSKKLCETNGNEQGRILQNVLETEHQRKISRYDLHIRSLISNAKGYKKNLEVVEGRYDALMTKSKNMVDIEQLRAMNIDLQEMRRMFETSQQEIDNLKHQLKTMNEQFYVTDASKSSNMMDLTNLMDDYKKLIQQSQTTTKRPSTSEIYELINKSNNFVPKLTNISTSVDGLKDDIQQVCNIINLLSSPPAGRTGSPQSKMSLMEELKFADNKK